MESKGEKNKMNLELHYTGLLRLSRLDLTVSFSTQVFGRETNTSSKSNQRDFSNKREQCLRECRLGHSFAFNDLVKLNLKMGVQCIQLEYKEIGLFQSHNLFSIPTLD